MPRLASPAARLSGALAAQIVFALLIAATIGAFFVTTRLKRSAPVVEQLTFARYVSPNGDGRHDFTDIGFRIKRADEVTVAVLSEEGDELRVLARDRELGVGRHRLRWNGRIEGGRVAPDGEYRLRIGLRRQGRSVTSGRKLFVDTSPPRPVVRYVSPDSISPDGVGSRNSARLRFDGPLRRRPTLLVYRTDLREPRLAARRAGRRGSAELVWDGLVGPPGRRRPAATGNYALVVQTRDAAGNLGPIALPPTRGVLAGHPGIVVRYISALAPSGPLRGGAEASFGVDSDGRRYRWIIRRLGSSRVLERGSSRARTLRLRVPRGRSGVFFLTLRTGGHRFQTPLAVQARRRARALVVLPVTTWQARNRLDTNGDGFADVLPDDRSVPFRRPFAGDGLPDGFTAVEGPLLLHLDRAGLRYDITSDLALGSGSSRPPARYDGVLFAGPPRFFGSGIGGLARSYVRAGGRLTWIGTGGFTQPVRVTKSALETARDSGSGTRNVFGERLRPRSAGGALTVLSDRIEFFRGVGGAFGPFPALEVSARLPAGSALLASAGHEASRPSLVVYRRGRGIVTRVGADGFARAAADSPDVARIMRRLWILLSR